MPTNLEGEVIGYGMKLSSRKPLLFTCWACILLLSPPMLRKRKPRPSGVSRSMPERGWPFLHGYEVASCYCRRLKRIGCLPDHDEGVSLGTNLGGARDDQTKKATWVCQKSDQVSCSVRT